ncbi:class I SAM-dependent methyltransferase [Altererythrobacter sp.]|uniref:class I SAM-dependent methyltransferase n=1 Tax=Altererythrobacter sp. TaxID=1872480 RepID=UPI001B1AA0BB|nr:class I SAM-dependent methyltransferase [Altererythrobacter sp.]MBO6944609.1 class I SAM-dependent methyltransferase [Altererythrobacter sp.]
MANFSSQIIKCIEDAERGVLDTGPNEVVTGFAGDKLTGLIQRLTRTIGKDYLEVGVFQGSSLLNTAYCNPDIQCYGIDNFSQFDPQNQNKRIVISRADQLGVKNYSLIDKDFEDGLQEFDGEAGVFFIDGPHDYRSQLMCLIYGTRVLARNGCMIVDDANYAHVRQATRDFLVAYPEYKLVFEAYTSCHPKNMTNEQLAQARAGWWDGVHLIVHDPENEFESLVPPTPSNERFIRDHNVHIVGDAAVAWEAAMLLASLRRPWHLPRDLARYLRNYWLRRHESRGRFRSVNTESSGLPTRIAKTTQS